MVVHWGYSGSWLGKLLDAPTGAGEATQPGQEGADNADKVVGGDGVSFQGKYRGKNVGLTKPLIIAIALIVVSGARYIMSKSSPSHLRMPQLLLDDASVQQYLIEFNEAAENMKEAWGTSDVIIRDAFQLHFSPSLEDGKALFADPLAIISDHVDKMQKCKVPPHSSVKARKEFVQHLHLLRNICRAVTLRLHELMWMMQVSDHKKVPIPVPGYDQPYVYSPREEAGGKIGRRSTAAQFLNYAELFGGDKTQKVDEELSSSLLFLTAIADKHESCNFVARYYFERFLEPFGEEGVSHASRSAAKHHIPYTGKVFRSGKLAEAAAPLLRESGKGKDYAYVRKIYSIADDWTDQRVLAATKLQEEENTRNFQARLNIKREQMRVLLKEGLPRDDLAMAVLFLL
ncbi:hypothetical protein EPH_0000820 [Eimeria praecox]|uniref:Uncharacterized protein n=1 Tax=Eimeria praecox TaxID=51316 RepID=U6G3J6_9EIME|nr:hypothetical protein EPH_0000820 [Eimeria praecox]